MMRLALIPALLMGGQALAYRPLSTVEQLELQYVRDDAIRLLPIAWDTVNPEVIIVPEDHPTIQAAVDASPRTNQTILVRDGVHNENVVIMAEDFDDLVIEGECGALPTVDSYGTSEPTILIDNTANALTTITLRNLRITGSTEEYGVEVRNTSDPYDAVTTTLYASRCRSSTARSGFRPERGPAHTIAGDSGGR